MSASRFLLQQTVFVLLTVFTFGNLVLAQETPGKKGNVDIYGDFRIRIEDDFGNHESSGDELEGRTRARVRVRLGAEYSPYDHIKLGMRVRSGLVEGQQIANITIYDFDGNNTGDADFSFDKWYLEYIIGGLSTWMGRNSIPYWHQNQLYWDDDVIPVGFGASYNSGLGKGKLELNGGLFSLPAGMQAFAGRLLLAQIVYDIKIAGIGLTAAGGLHAITADNDDPDRLIFLDENGDRDYTILKMSLQARAKLWDIPTKFGLDFAFNTEDYKDTSAGSFTQFHRDEVSAYALSVIFGETKEPWDWEAGYSYAYIEMFAVNNSFAQDDWVRWGTAEQIRNSNFKGHEFFGIITFPRQFSVVARIYIVEGIKLRTPESTQVEDGNRFRFDVNYHF
jgi:hypothetical protein